MNGDCQRNTLLDVVVGVGGAEVAGGGVVEGAGVGVVVAVTVAIVEFVWCCMVEVWKNRWDGHGK